MKKILYFILLAVETFVGILFMISLCNHSLYIPVAIALASVAGLLAWQIVAFFKTTNAELKRRIAWRFAMIMLIPTAVFFATCAVVAVILIFAFL